MPRVAVLGGGITGLAAAFRLQELARERDAGLRVDLYERAEPGGCVQTLQRDGFTMERGPDSLLIDKPAAAHLLERLGLSGQVVEMRPEFKGARIVHRGRLRPIPPDFRFFTPTSLPALLAAGIFSPAGIARAALEPFIPKRAAGGDESLASFVTRRLGREILDRLAQPLIGGIYSGDPQRLSMQATLPQFLEMEQHYGSLIRAMQAASGKRPPMRLVSLRDGLGSIVNALRERLGAHVHSEREASAVGRDNGVWRIAFADGDAVEADAVIFALPAYAAGKLLRTVDPELDAMLGRIRYNSIATVNLAYDAAASQALPRSSGFVVPFVEGRSITAATFSTQKYPYRSPDRFTLVRAFIGGALQPELLERTDEQLAVMARRDLADLARLRDNPHLSIVTRWERALPEYGVGHAGLVAGAEARAAALPGCALAGAAYRGVGIPDCIASGEAGAESVFGYLSR